MIDEYDILLQISANINRIKLYQSKISKVGKGRKAENSIAMLDVRSKEVQVTAKRVNWVADETPAVKYKY